MPDNEVIMTVASWEERFLLGLKALIKTPPSKVVMYFLKEYADITEENRTEASQICRERNITLLPKQLTFNDPVMSWKTVLNSIFELDLAAKRVTVDITTMPREIIWTVFDLLQAAGAEVTYAYHKPREYSREWLSRDPGRPRLVFKLAGVTRLRASTKLLILTGFDVDRVRQMIFFFEPELTLIGMQTGEQFDNQAFNVCKHVETFKDERRIHLFDVNAYSNDHGFAVIEEQIKPHLENSNIIMTSLGPKLTAVALYKLHKLYPNTSLAYAPSGEFNTTYSKGISETITGRLKFEPRAVSESQP
jgi:hypothetical protein